MKPRILANVVALMVGFGTGDALAQAASCSTGPFLTGAALVSTLNGKYVCAKRPGGATADIWNEFHRGTGSGPFPIIDYKRGPSDPVDPSKVVGTYTINTSVTPGTVTYDYGASGGSYTYKVKTTPTPSPETPAYLFCNVATAEAIPAIVSTSPTHALCTSP